MKERIKTLDLNEVFQHSPFAFYATDSEGLLTYFNDTAVKLFGETPELGSEMKIHPWKLFYSDGTPMPIEDCPMVKCLTEGKAYDNSRLAVEGTDGNISQLLVFSRPVFTAQGETKGSYHTMVDITPHHKTDLKQETLSAIVESSDDAVISENLNGIILSWNRGAEKIFGYTEAEIIGKPTGILIPKNRRDDEELLLDKIRKGERIDHYETIRKHKNGQEIPISLTISPIRDGKGKTIGATKVARDISERLKGEEKQAVLSAIVESSDDAIISKNLNGIILSWNKGAEHIFGYSEEEILGKPVTMLIPAERYAEEDLILEKVGSGGRVDNFETVRMHKSGKNIYVSLTVSPIRDNSGKTIGASKIARDITAQVKAKEEIARHTRNLEILNALGKSISRKMDVQAVLQQVTNATTQLSGAEFGIFFYNVANDKGNSFHLSAISGVSPESLKDVETPEIIELFNLESQETTAIRSNDITQKGRLEQNLYTDLSVGHLHVRSYLAVPVMSPSGDVLGGLFLGHPQASRFTAEHEDLVTNITAQAAITLDNSKLFERVMALSDKKDEFIALASHELRTPLTTINGYLQMLAKTEKDQMSELFLSKSLYQVNKLNTLVEDLLNMSRIEAGRMEFNTEDFDLCDLLRDVTQTFSYTTKTHRLIHQLGDKPAMVHADKQRIEQAINNLMSNAVKYSPKAHKVYLRLTNHQGEVEVTIRDEGIGLSPEQQEKLFSRFYRAGNHKGISGLGLGLYLTKQIIDRHKGRLHLKSETGKGSEFSFTLPLITGQNPGNVDK